MNCPNCNEYAPDNNYKCPHCGEVLKPEVSPADFRPAPAAPRRISPNLLILLVIVVGLAVLIYAALSRGGGQKNETTMSLTTSTTTSESGEISVGRVVNTENPGEEIDIQEFVQAEKTTIFDFYSDYCGPCRKIAPYLERLDRNRSDIIVHRVDINRSGIRAIDWGSPVAQQYKIRSVPHFVIYDPSGKLTHQGREAYTEVMRLLQGK